MAALGRLEPLGRRSSRDEAAAPRGPEAATPFDSELDLLRDAESIVNFDPQISDGAFDRSNAARRSLARAEGMMPDTGKGAALLETARTFRPRILEQRDLIEASRRLPEDLARELARAGFFRIFLPAAYGGLDLAPMEGLAVFEELARADASVAWCVWNGNTHWTAAQLSAEAARTIHADPDVITANSTRPSGQAHVVAGGYRVSGRWSLVSGCELAAWMVLWCVVHEEGKPRLTPSGAPELRFMLLPAAECEIIDTWTVGGLRGTGSHDVAAHDLFVPSTYGSGFFDPYVLPEPRYRVPAFCRVIPGLGAMALGIARTAIDDGSATAD